MFSEELAIFARSDVQKENMTLMDLEGQTVSITIGYTYPTEFMQNSRIKKFSVDSDLQQLRMVAMGHVRYAIVNTMPGYLRINSDPSLKGKLRRVGRIGLDGFWVAFSKRHADGKRMSKLFEVGLQKLKASGRYDDMVTALHKRLRSP